MGLGLRYVDEQNVFSYYRMCSLTIECVLLGLRYVDEQTPLTNMNACMCSRMCACLAV